MQAVHLAITAASGYNDGLPVTSRPSVELASHERLMLKSKYEHVDNTSRWIEAIIFCSPDCTLVKEDEVPLRPHSGLEDLGS